MTRNALAMTGLLIAMLVPQGSFAQDTLPMAIQCYQSSTNAKDIDAYMACFTEGAETVDVSRVFKGRDAIRPWAEREVIPSEAGDAARSRPSYPW